MSQRHAVLALLAPATAKARTFYGTVGPGNTITLKRADGTIVRRVQNGRHTFVICGETTASAAAGRGQVRPSGNGHRRPRPPR
jgi:hypothetical protein